MSLLDGGGRKGSSWFECIRAGHADKPVCVLDSVRGDAAINYDAPVSSEQILGKVVSIERNGRRIDPYNFRIKLLYKARRLATRLKRLLSLSPRLP